MRTADSRIAAFFEWLFFAWISAFASIIFLVSAGLTVFQVLSLMQLAYVYGAITLITLAIAFALYMARRD